MTDLSDTPTLTGDLVALRPADGRDAPCLHALMADPEVTRLTGSAHSSEDLTSARWSVEQLVEVYDRWSKAEDRLVWAVVERTSGAVVGEALLLDHDPGNRSCSFRIWISGARDRGLGTEATRLAVGHAFTTLGLHRVQLEVYAFNPRARRVYEKVGFVLEGTQREALLFDGRWVDLHLMGMLEQDWRAAAGR
ncbi:GNAT family N-acetyltransferase [Ornithinimicrobium pekingense]|uniref:Acetyltransferase n=1 Tax=Ornithinimicrobium pekingense TaxID=384677 RepID=A0ABQ2F3I6_9MICO|nr:GNAT family protein [Ornithinimicrobium pekingense]GGK57186.1 acetyltransferase [Ornithinimicrobium pekingense]